MYWFKNLKIRLKLVVGFGVVIILAAAMGVFAIMQVMNINQSYQDLLNGAVEGRISALRAEANIRAMRRTLTQTGMMAPTADAVAINGLYAEMRGFYNALGNALDDYDNSVVNDDGLTQEEIDHRIGLSNAVRTLASRYVYEIAIPARDLALEGDHSGILALAGATGHIINDLVANSTYIWQLEQARQVMLTGLVVDSADQSMYALAVVIAVVVLIAAVMALAIAGIISKPINNMVALVGDVSQGKLNVNVDRSRISKDEIGKLTTDVLGLVDVIRVMVDDLTAAQHEYIQVGNMHYAIDDAKYQNSFKDMIGLVNNLLATVTTDIEGIAKALDNVGNGNFDEKVDFDIWVGEWKIVPNALDGLLTNITSVSSEITAMIDSVANRGDLSFQIDETMYKGDWKAIMAGLNSISKAVYEPIRAIEVGMVQMKEGVFNIETLDKNITQAGYNPNPDAYNGTFRNTIAAFDETVVGISSYINELEQVLANMARGDLRNNIQRQYVGSFDLIKESVNNINSTLHKTMSDISMASEQVLSGAKQISTSAQELANGAQEQASSVEELNATIDVVSQQTRLNAENATTASELSNNTAVNAQHGNVSMKEMLTAMSQIKESSSEISKVIKAIEDISFQTNLLALNASVEAARAGEHGKGFSVVADEVRSLAGRSSDSAAETNNLIATSISRVDSGSDIAVNTAASLDAIVDNINEVSSIISSIAVASQGQAEAIAQISEGLEQISKVTQSNSAVSEETAAASQELNSQAEMLQELVRYFKL